MQHLTDDSSQSNLFIRLKNSLLIVIGSGTQELHEL